MLKPFTLSLYILLFWQTVICWAQTTIDPNFKPVISNNRAEIYTLASQPDGKVLVGGNFQFINGKAYNNLSRLNPDGTVDPTFDIGKGPNNSVGVIKLQTDGKILVAGRFTSFNNQFTTGLMRLNSNGTIDGAFTIITALDLTGINNIVELPNGKILLGGSFYFRDKNKETSIIRLNNNGTLDTSFASECSGNFLFGLAVQSDGKIVLGGTGDNTGSKLIRLKPDGTSDKTFTPNTGIVSQYVRNIALQNDKIIVMGKADGANTPYKIGLTKVIRLNANGSPDNSFSIGTIEDEVRNINLLKVLPNNKILLGGNFESYNKNAISSLVQLNADGSFDYNFKNDVNSGGEIKDIAVQNNRILIAGWQLLLNGSSSRKPFVRLQADGSLDSSLESTLNIGSNGVIYKLATTADNKVLIAGSLTGVNNKKTQSLARLLPDGRLDESFNSSDIHYYSIRQLVVQPDNKILIAGEWDPSNSWPYKYLIRLNPDGTLDPTFNLNVPEISGISEVLLLKDGKILVVAATPATSTYTQVFRLHANGSKDATFNTGTGAIITGQSYGSPSISTLVSQSDGKIIVGGHFNSYNGTPKNIITRLLPNGAVDNTFSELELATSNGIFTMAVQPDDKILIGGTFNLANYRNINGIARLQANGQVDESFITNIGGTPQTILVESTGSIVVGGYFTYVNGLARGNIVGLNANGTINNKFNVGPGANNAVLTIASLPDDGTVYFGGEFSQINNESQFSVARMLPSAPVAPTSLLATLIAPNKVNLTWSDQSDNELGFEIQRSIKPETDFVAVDTTSAKATAYQDINLLGGTTFYYRLRAINLGGASEFTEVVSITTHKVNQTLTFSEISDKEWKDNPFTVVATSSAALPVSFSIVSGPATISNNLVSVTGKGVVQIKASQPGNANFKPAPDVIQSFTVHEASPTILSVSDNTTTGLTLSWDGPSPEFKILRKSDASSISPHDGEVVYQGTAKSFTYTTELTPNTAYFFTVYGKSAAEESYSIRSKKLATSTTAPASEKGSTAAFLAGETGTKTLPNVASRVAVTQPSSTDGYIQVTSAANPAPAELPTGIKTLVDTKFWKVTGVGLDTRTIRYDLTLDVTELTDLYDVKSLTVLQRTNNESPWTILENSDSGVQKSYQDNKLTITNLRNFPQLAFGVNTVTGLRDLAHAELSLEQNFPNPFDNSTTIRYQIKKQSNVVLEVIDVQGRIVQKLVQQTQKPGSYQVLLDGKNLRSRSIYFIRLRTNKAQLTITAAYQ